MQHTRICVFIYSNINVFAFIYTYTYLYSVHKHLWPTVWTEMMSNCKQANGLSINKINRQKQQGQLQSAPLFPLFPLGVCPQANWWPLCGRRKGVGVGGHQQHLIKTQITETSGQCKKLFLRYISMWVCACLLLSVCVCECILEISSFQQHFRQLNHVRNEKWTCPRRMWPEQRRAGGGAFGAIILTRLQAGASKIYNMT